MKAVAGLQLMLVLISVVVLSNQFQVPGGLSEAIPADDYVQQLCNEVRDDLEQQMDQPFDEYTAIEYKYQVVAGFNYYVKVRVGTGDYIQVHIFQPLNNNEAPSLGNFKDIGEFEEIGFF